MTYRSLLLHLDSDPHCAARTDLAIRLAKQYDCHLVGLAATGQIYMPVLHEAAAATQAELAALAWAALRDEAQAATHRFRDACRAAEFKSFETVVDERDKAASIVQRAHCSDLVIVSQEEPRTFLPSMAQSVVEQVVMSSARPVLVLPYTGRWDAFGSTALVAWDDSREAARAVSDALPLLRQCQAVQVVAWREGVGTEDAASLQQRLDALRQWLLWQGVTSEVCVEATDTPVAEALLSRAADLGSSFIVMGAYGHTRLSERVLGGATRGLLQSMTVPVLMSH